MAHRQASGTRISDYYVLFDNCVSAVCLTEEYEDMTKKEMLAAIARLEKVCISLTKEC
jgi:hypothetical protein